MGRHILIIEDQGELSVALARRFTRRGFTVLECCEPAAALEILRQEKIDLCICDINLNDRVSGLDIFVQFKTLGLTVPFVFFTGLGEDTDEIQQAKDLGADAVFVKPTDFGVLLERVCALLGLAVDTVSLAGSRPPAS